MIVNHQKEAAMILVTGAGGHIGNVLVRELVIRGQKVRALLLDGEDSTPLKGLDIEIMEGNILRPADLARAMQGVDTVYHLASMISISPGMDEIMRRINIEGTQNVIDAVRAAGVKRLVYTSSIHALCRPPEGEMICEDIAFDPQSPAGPYDRTKAEASLLVQKAVREGMDAVIVCPTGVVGPYDYKRSEMGLLVLGWIKDRINLLVEGSFDFVDVRDVALGHILACEHGKPGGVYLLSGERISLKQMAKTVQETTGRKASTIVVPFGLATFATYFTPLWYRITRTKARFTRYALETVSSNSFISNEKARRELGYNPRSMRESLIDTVKWWQEHQHLWSASADNA
jgi:dihydroflavonol-4-reductase